MDLEEQAGNIGRVEACSPGPDRESERESRSACCKSDVLTVRFERAFPTLPKKFGGKK